MMRTAGALILLLALGGCTSVQFMGGSGNGISTAWGSNTCCGMNWSPVPTASAGGNSGH